MKTVEIQIESLKFDCKKKDAPKKSDYECLITEPCIVIVLCRKKVITKFLYCNIPSNLSTHVILDACRKLYFKETIRTNELESVSKIIGYTQRTIIRNNECSLALSALESPKAHETLMRLGGYIAKVYKQYLPDEYLDHMEKAKGILTDYMVDASPFTSGIVNKNSALTYHRDEGNIPDTMSCMLALKKEQSGGYLSFPQLNLAFECCNNSLLFMDGQKWIHGVTPITLSNNGYRYTIVFYTLKGMFKCLPINEELKHARQIEIIPKNAKKNNN